MRTRKIIAALLALLMVVCLVPFTAFAADVEVVELNGERIAFVSSFGKMNYEGKSYKTFRTFNDAVVALGAQGGTIVFTGTAKLADFADLAGRDEISVVGIGTKSSGNLLDFTGTAEAPVSEVSLAGDIFLDFVNLRMDAGAYLLTNGYNFTTDNEFDTYHVEIYNAAGANPIEYRNPPSIAVGKSEGHLGLISIDAGTFSNIASGAVNGHTVNGSGFVKIAGGKIENLVNGNVSGTTNGNVELTVENGAVVNLVAGPVAGTVNGNVITSIKGGNIGTLVIGPETGATVNGSLVLTLKNGSISSVTLGGGTVTGKKIVMANNDELAALLPANAADYVIKIAGGYCEPQFDGANVNSFLICDKYGVPAENVTINGAAKSAANGIYQLSAGKNDIVVASALTVAVNKNANYVAGYEDGTFRPQNNMTKAEAITLLSRIIVDENLIKGKVSSTFTDVADGAWYEPYVGFFEKLGFLDLICDASGTLINPTANITRGEFVQLIYEIANLDIEGSSATKLIAIPDVTSKNPFSGAISYAVSSGVVTGYEDGTFRSDNNITRAEVVTMVNRFLGRIPTGVAGTVSFADSANHWANGQILAACNPEGVAWTGTEKASEYVLTGTSAKDYTIALYEQGKNLSADAILRGVDVITEQMKKDILNTPNTADIYGDKIKEAYYISEKNGNDDNDGKSPETAVKTIAGLNKKLRFPRAGTAFLFERGGVYRGTISVGVNGIILGSYGEGPKPIIMQSKKNYADPNLWVETNWPNVYKCTESLYNVGVIGFDHDLQDYSEETYNETYGWIMNVDLFDFSGVQDMNKDLQFYSVLTNDRTTGGAVKQNDLYVYSTEGNPGSRFKSIEIGENVAIVSGKGNDVIIDNISFKFTGGHGMGGAGGCKNRTVTNCIYSWIGGSILSLSFGNSGKPVNYGNAIEIYGSCDGYLVENNWIYQIYDTAVTHQFSDGSACTQEGVRYLGNLMEYCFWGIEFYNSPGDGTTPAAPAATKYTRDVISAYNVLNESGYGWGSTTRYRSGYAYCGSSLSLNEDQHANYNVFNKCSGYLLNLPSNSTETPDKNIYIQTRGLPLGNLKGYNVTCNYDAAEQIAKRWGDKNAIVIVLEPEPEEV